jgi:hypothetical protein
LQDSGFRAFLLNRSGAGKPLTGGAPDFTGLKFGSAETPGEPLSGDVFTLITAY